MPTSNWIPAARNKALPGQPDVLPYIPAPEPFSEEESAEGVLDYGRSVWRRKGIFLAIIAASLAIAGALAYFQPRVYQSEAAVEIQDTNEDFLNLKDVDPTSAPASDRDSYVETQAEILNEDAMVERVVKKLGLTELPEFQYHPGFLERTLGSRWSRPTTPLAYVVKVIKSNLTVIPPRQGRVIRIQYSSTDPQFAATFANTLVSTYIDQNVQSRWQAAAQVNEWLRPQLDELRTRLQKDQAELQSYSRSAGLLITDGQETVATEKLREIQAELMKAQADRIAKEPIYALSQSGQVEGVADNPAAQQYQLLLTDLRKQLANLDALFTPQNPKVVQLQAQIAEVESALKRETANTHRRVQNEYSAAQERETLLTQAYQRQSALVSELSAKMDHYNALKHEADTTRQVYDAMVQKVSDAGIASAIRPSNIRVVGPAEAATAPFKPNVPLDLAVGLFTGLVLATGSVLMLEQTDRRLRAPGDIGVTHMLPELGAIPSVPRLHPLSRRLLRSAGKDGAIERITWEQKDSQFSESFRAVLASILLPSRNGETPRVLVITSPQPGEGKTTVASNLAIALAEIKHRVLLIDGDLRRPRLHQIFDVANTTGLSDLLCEKESILDLPTEQLVKKTTIPNLNLLPSGPGPDGIFNRLYSPRMLRLCCRFREEFDHVIIDAPPTLEFADARILARNAEGVILVFRANRTNKRTALAVIEQLMRDRIPILGTVLNDWNPKTAGGYGDYAYRQPYGYQSGGDAYAVAAAGTSQNQ